MLSKTILVLCLFTAVFSASVAIEDFGMELIDVGDEDTVLDSMFFQYTGACAKGGLLTQSGAIWKTWWESGSDMEKNAGYARSDVVAVQFEETFQQTPQVAVSLKGFDIHYANAGIHVYATDITTSGFNIVIEAPVGSYVYAAQVSWLATLSHTTQLWFHRHSINADDSKELQEKSVGQGPRSILQKFKYSRELTNPGVIVGIAGFEFGSGRNIRLKVEPTQETTKTFKLDATTWWDTTWLAADYQIIVFEKDVAESFIVESSTTGALFNGADVRKETKYVPLADASRPVQIFSTIKYIDFIDGHNYRLTAETSVEGGNIALTYTTWADTQTYLVHHYVLAVPTKPKAIMTQSDKWSYTYWNTGHRFLSGNGVRDETYQIKFPTAFTETPAVAIAITGFDFEWANAAVKSEILDVTTEGFTLKITAPAGSVIYLLEYHWIATISSQSGIYFDSISKWSDSDSEISNIITGLGERNATFYSANPGTTQNPGAVSSIHSFAFGGANPRLKTSVDDVTESGASVTISTWWDTVFYGAGVTIVHYDKDCGNGHIQIDSSTTGPLYGGGPKERFETLKGQIGFSGAVLFPGLNYIDFIAGYNYRLQQNFTLTDNVVVDSTKVWWDTQLFLIKDAIFYTDPYRYVSE